MGIDPGTTLGYAALDLNGKVVAIGSSKQIGLDKLIRITTKIGKVVVVGCDKARVPSFVEEFSRKFRVRLVWPKEDLLVSEKKDFVRGFDYKDDHQRDALASALFALKQVRKLLNKVDVFVRRNQKEKYSDRIKELVLTTERLSIKAAFEMLTKPEKEHVKKIRKVVESKVLSKKDYFELYDKLKKVYKENDLVLKQNKRLKKEVFDLNKRVNKLIVKKEKEEKDKKTKQQLSFKEKNIGFLSNQIKFQEKELRWLRKDIEVLNSFLADSSKSVLIKRLNNFGLKGFEKRDKKLRIVQGDVLLVDDVSIISERVIGLLKQKVDVVVYKKNLTKKLEKKLPFVFINAGKLKLKETKYFAIVGEKEFNIVKNKVGLLKKIVFDYRKTK